MSPVINVKHLIYNLHVVQLKSKCQKSYCLK